MTIHRLDTFPEQERAGFMPSQDGPVVHIDFPNAAGGFRRVVAAEGDLSGVQPDTIKYLLEITAVNGTVNTVARTLRLFSFNVETKELNYLHTVSGLPSAMAPIYDYGEGFWVNVAGGYYTIESNKTVYVIGLDNGVTWGNSGAIIGYNSFVTGNLSGTGTTVHIIPHTNGTDFYLSYTSNSAYTAIRAVMVDTNNKTINWGTEIVRTQAANSYGAFSIPDRRVGQPPNQYLMFSNSVAGSGNFTIAVFYFTLDASTGNVSAILKSSPTTNYSATGNLPSRYPVQGSGLYNGKILFGGIGLTNMQFYTFDLDSGDVVAVSSWGTSGVRLSYGGLQYYYDPDGTYGKYSLFSDVNTDVFSSKDDFDALNVGSFGTALFRATTVISGFTLSGTMTSPYNHCKPIIPCKYGFFYVGQMNTQGTSGPVVWYPLKPNL